MSIVKLTAENYAQEVEKADKPVVIDFWADWCGPCRMFSLVYESCADELSGIAKFAKLNVDDEPDLARKFKVMSIPTVAIMKEGELVEKKVGALYKEELDALIKEVAK